MSDRNNTKLLGDEGEKLACEYLVKNGYKILGRNYRINFGEIYIIAKKRGWFADKTIHFVEVKTVSRESYNGKFEENKEDFRPKTFLSDKNVRPNNHSNDCFRPEDNLHPWKIKKLVKF